MERILVAYLRASERVTEIVGERVGTRTPGALDQPWVRVTYYDDPPAGRSSTDHHVAFYVQCDCYAGKKSGSKSNANRLAATVRELLDGMADADHAGAVVTGSKPTGSRPLLDDSKDPPMERYIVTATVWAYGVEEGS